MNLTLKNISVNERLSEETNCFAAVLYIDGNPIADVGNRGHGGPDEVHARAGCADALAKAEAWCKSLPPLTSQYFADGLAMDLELWCSGKVEDHLSLRDMRKALKKSVLTVEDGKLYSHSFIGVKQVTPEHVARVKAQKPGVQVLNDMPEHEALAVYMKMGG